MIHIFAIVPPWLLWSIVTVAIITSVLAYYVLSWWAIFNKNRFSKGDVKSPSGGNVPHMKSGLRDQTNSSKLDIISRFEKKSDPRYFLSRFRAHIEVKKEQAANDYRELEHENSTQNKAPGTKYDKDLMQFLWGIAFIGINSQLLWSLNVPLMLIRRALTGVIFDEKVY